MKIPPPTPEEEAIEAMARQARVEVSKMSPQERKDLADQAMHLIYASSKAKRAVGAGHKLSS
jgi:hypothetical protein